MSQQDVLMAQQLRDGLEQYEQDICALKGISNVKYRDTLVRQLVESLRRIRYITRISQRDVSNERANPSSDLFDPERAAVLRKQQGQIDEAFWLIFLSIHFGKNLRTEWRLVRDIYGRLGDGSNWDWTQVSADPKLFSKWLSTNLVTLKGGDGVKRTFGNHRKYQSLNPYSPTGTGAAINSYVAWVKSFGTHNLLIEDASVNTDGSPRAMFKYLYKNMSAVATFGRTAKFDYLTMIGKLGLAPIEPDSTYMHGATGPFDGAKLLYTGKKTSSLGRSQLDAKLIQLESYLHVGMQAMEDALCNWQKSPGVFKSFRG